MLAVTLIFLALLLAALLAGLFFAFSVTVMPAFDLIDPNSAIAAMTSINRVIQNPIFFVCFFLMPVVAVIAGILLLRAGQQTAAWLIFAAAAVYIIAGFIPTLAINVPMNNALELVALPQPLAEASRLWQDYSPRWTWWNTVRTIACSISTLLAAGSLMAWMRF